MIGSWHYVAIHLLSGLLLSGIYSKYINSMALNVLRKYNTTYHTGDYHINMKNLNSQYTVSKDIVTRQLKMQCYCVYVCMYEFTIYHPKEMTLESSTVIQDWLKEALSYHRLTGSYTNTATFSFNLRHIQTNIFQGNSILTHFASTKLSQEIYNC